MEEVECRVYLVLCMVHWAIGQQLVVGCLTMMNLIVEEEPMAGGSN